MSELEQGGARRLWKDAHQALTASREGGWLAGPPTLYASAPGSDKVAHAVPEKFGVLLFTFPPGVAAFAELISKPRLVALVAMDRSSRYFISVRFANKA